MKVHLHYPIKKSGLTYYTSMYQHPPRDVEFTEDSTGGKLIISQKGFKGFNFAKKVVRGATEMMRATIVNAHRSKRGERGDVNLIHGAHCIIKTDKPWVCDVEGCWQFWISGKYTDKGKAKVAEYLNKPNCKKIIAWTNEAADRIKGEFMDYPKIPMKITTLYPGVPIPTISHKDSPLNKEGCGKEYVGTVETCGVEGCLHNCGDGTWLCPSCLLSPSTIRLLFVGRYFYHKGGDIALKVMDEITRNNPNVEATIISDTPVKEIKKHMSNEQIKFLPLTTQEDLFKNIYTSHDIFIYPGTHDSLGFCLLEAMSFGLPVITMDGTARSEIINNEESGYIIEKHEDINKTIEKMIVRTKFLIANPEIRRGIGALARKRIQSKFSIDSRNIKLKQIYEEALK